MDMESYSNLPNEMIYEIISYLPLKTLFNFFFVCRKYNELLSSEPVMKMVVQRIMCPISILKKYTSSFSTYKTSFIHVIEYLYNWNMKFDGSFYSGLKLGSIFRIGFKYHKYSLIFVAEKIDTVSGLPLAIYYGDVFLTKTKHKYQLYYYEGKPKLYDKTTKPKKCTTQFRVSEFSWNFGVKKFNSFLSRNSSSSGLYRVEFKEMIKTREKVLLRGM